MKGDRARTFKGVLLSRPLSQSWLANALAACCIFRNTEKWIWTWDSNCWAPMDCRFNEEVGQGSRNGVWISVEEALSSSRGYDKIVTGLKKMRPYTLAHPFGPSASRESTRKKRCWYRQSPQHRIWCRMLVPPLWGLGQLGKKNILRPRLDQMWSSLNILISHLKE